MNKKEDKWFILFDDVKTDIEWIFKTYGISSQWKKILEYRQKGDKIKIQRLLSNLWYVLPEGSFNIKKNAEKWDSFMSLIEE